MSWIDAGTNLISETGGVVRFDKIEKGAPSYAMYSKALEGAAGQYEVIYKGGDSAYVGLTSSAHFGQGYKIKGVSYHGNLSDGSGLIHSRFGPPIKDGDRVNIQIHKGATLDVYFKHNGKPLGQAAALNDFPTEPLHLFVGSKAEGCTFSVKELPPSPVEEFCPNVTPTADLEGTYKYISGSFLDDGAAPATVPPETQATFTLEKGDTEAAWKLNAKLRNSMFVQLRRDGPEAFASEGHVGSTLMVGDPAEGDFSRLLGGISGLKKEGNTLILTAGPTSARGEKFIHQHPPATGVRRFVSA